MFKAFPPDFQLRYLFKGNFIVLMSNFLAFASDKGSGMAKSTIHPERNTQNLKNNLWHVSKTKKIIRTDDVNFIGLVGFHGFYSMR